MGRSRTIEIRHAITEEVFWSSRSPVAKVARRFGVTQQAILLHIRSLITDNYIAIEGENRYRRYYLQPILEREKRYALTPQLTEDAVWREFFQPLMTDINLEADATCHHGVTEMVNNVIDHSAGKMLRVKLTMTSASLEIQIADDGIGIFQKIANALGLSDPRQSLLELSKGKFTTDPERHTGEGLFFTSRIFDKFYIRSSDLFFHHSTQTDDWLLDVKDRNFKGTRLTMGLLLPPQRTLKEVYDRFSSGPDDHRFAKTHVPLELATFGDESLVSRSSAKRVLNRVDRFDEVLLDFRDIRTIGQAFADEIFRVFANAHPNVSLIAINANEQVTGMISRAKSNRREGDPNQTTLF